MAKAIAPTRSKLQTLRDVLVIVALLAAIPLAIFGIVMSLRMAHEVTAMKQVNAGLLQEVTLQRKVAQQQLQLNQTLLGVSQQQLEINKSLLETTKGMDAKLSESLRLQRQMLTTAQATLQQTRQINSKMPNFQHLNATSTAIPQL